MKKCLNILLLAILSSTAYGQTNGQPYLCELGLQGGIGYYVGDATPHIFMNVREAYGVHFRYKLTRRWALRVQASGQHITGHKWEFEPGTAPRMLDAMWQNRLWSGDVVAEFNFFRYDATNKYDNRNKPYTPYIFVGLGASYHEHGPISGYLPLGAGFKWKFAPRWGLNMAWQHNIYFSDDLEGQSNMNDRYKMNGSSWLNCDLTGMLMVGIVFEFAKAPAACRSCTILMER